LQERSAVTQPKPTGPAAQARPGQPDPAPHPVPRPAQGPGQPSAQAPDAPQAASKPDPKPAAPKSVPTPAAAAAKPAAPPVPPPVIAARGQRRHVLLALSFGAMVLLPILVSAWYLWARAQDQYASYVGFSVRTEEVGSAIELLGGITELSGSSSSDTDILYKFLQSQELVATVDAALDLRTMWSRADPAVDPVFAYDPPGTIEDLVDHWSRKVAIYYDSGSGLLDLRVLAFAPDDAQAIARMIFAESSAMINALSALAREDAIAYARDELDQAEARLRDARLALNEFRNRTQIVDPTIDTQGQMGLVTTLQAQLADALIEVDLLRETTREGDPRITQGELRIEVIERRIDEERRKVGLGGGVSGTGSVFADLVGEYERLVVDLEFAQQSYVAALATFDAARNEARRQSRYLAAHVRPTLAEKSQYPQRGMTLGLIGLFSFLAWAISALVAYSLRDRR
jgi:capsular polysaccharide transport system permease protein